jgi:hypothetical protein
VGHPVSPEKNLGLKYFELGEKNVEDDLGKVGLGTRRLDLGGTQLGRLPGRFPPAAVCSRID